VKVNKLCVNFQLIEYVDKDNTADMNDYKLPNSSWFGSYDLSAAAWKDLTFDNVSQTVMFTANNDNNDNDTISPFRANGSLSLKASATIFCLSRKICLEAAVHSYNMAFRTTSIGFCIDIISIIITLNCLHILVLSILLIMIMLHCIVLFIYSAVAASMLINLLLNNNNLYWIWQPRRLDYNRQ